jgi:hypothetical protein
MENSMKNKLLLGLAICIMATSEGNAFGQGILTQPFPVADPNVERLKNEIIRISRQHTTDVNTVSAVRRQLNPLIKELVESVPSRTETEKLPQTVGAWQQLWTDGVQIFVGPAPGQYDLSEVFQVVAPDGYYYNIGRYVMPGIDLTVFLRGAYKVGTNTLQVNFTKYVYGKGWLYSDSDFLLQTFRAEAGAFDSQPFNPPPDANPIGAPQLELSDIYVDDDLRILEAGSGQGSSIFVLLRVGSRR